MKIPLKDFSFCCLTSFCVQGLCVHGGEGCGSRYRLGGNEEAGAGGRTEPRGLGRGLRQDGAGGIKSHKLPGGMNVARGIEEVRVRGVRVKIHLLPLQSVVPFAKEPELTSRVGIFVTAEQRIIPAPSGSLGLPACNLGTSQPLPHLS